MVHSKLKAKPDKPRPDLPLFCHKESGHWAIKVSRKIVYFGKRTKLLAGRTLRTKENRITVAELVNQFLAHKESFVESGELA